MKLFEDISYSEDKAQILDFYLPESDENYDIVLISLHGGSWSMGDKSEYSRETEEFAKRLNVPTVNMNYRMTPALLPEMMEDVELAMSFITDYAKQFGCNFKKCILRGFSAGAHIVMSYAYQEKDSSPLPITFLIGESAPADLSTPLGGPAQAFICRGLSNIVGKKITRNNWSEHIEEMKALSPIYHLTPDAPPTLLLHGTEDYMVGYMIAESMYSALKDKDVPCDLVTFNGLEHQLKGCSEEMVEEYFVKVNSFFSKFSKT
ncbi:MAG: alpha/beta hydrolase [Clostridia bacterium]|nr:alpha/beta hydrolase [Clostridia bacterium]